MDMKNPLIKFSVLTVIGVAIGAGIALMQGSETPSTRYPADEMAATILSPSTIVPGAPEMPTPAFAKSVLSQMEPAAGTQVGDVLDLVDHKGQPSKDAVWNSKYKLVFFGFTHCPDICPTTLDKLTTVMMDMGTDGEKIQPLFVTTDPERDTTAIMASYVGNYHPSIIGLTGTKDQVSKAVDSYKVYASKVAGGDPENYMMDHSALIYLMSPDNQILETFGANETAEMIVSKVKGRITQ